MKIIIKKEEGCEGEEQRSTYPYHRYGCHHVVGRSSDHGNSYYIG